MGFQCPAPQQPCRVSGAGSGARGEGERRPTLRWKGSPYLRLTGMPEKSCAEVGPPCTRRGQSSGSWVPGLPWRFLQSLGPGPLPGQTGTCWWLCGGGQVHTTFVFMCVCRGPTCGIAQACPVGGGSAPTGCDLHNDVSHFLTLFCEALQVGSIRWGFSRTCRVWTGVQGTAALGPWLPAWPCPKGFRLDPPPTPNTQ